MHLSPFLLSAEIALIAASCSTLLAFFWVRFLYAWPAKYARIFELLNLLPLLLPPTVIGFYLLHFFGFLEGLLPLRLLFSFQGLLLASTLYALPFSIQAVFLGYKFFNARQIDAARLLGASPWRCMLRIELPLLAPSLVYAFALAFAHSLGELGMSLLVGGNIPGKTQVASLALLEKIENLQNSEAHVYALLLLGIGLFLLGLVYFFQRQTWREQKN